MIRIENNKINVYSKIDKKEMMQAMLLFGTACILALVYALISRKIFILIFAVIPGILLLIAYMLYKKSDKENISVSLSKEEFIAYRRNKKIKVIKCEDIINFAKPPISDDYNSIIVSYREKNGKKSAYSMLLLGYRNIEFIEIANDFLTNNISLENVESMVKNDKEASYMISTSTTTKRTKESNKKAEVMRAIRKGEEFKFTFLGKEKMFIKNGNRYSLERLNPCFIFVNNENIVLELAISDIKIDSNGLIPNNTYEISYNKRSGFIEIKLLGRDIDEEKLQELRNNIEMKSRITFDKSEINNEMSLYNKILKINKIIKLCMLAFFIIVFVIDMIKKQISPDILAIGFLTLLLAYPLIILVYIQEYKKKFLR